MACIKSILILSEVIALTINYDTETDYNYGASLTFEKNTLFAMTQQGLYQIQPDSLVIIPFARFFSTKITNNYEGPICYNPSSSSYLSLSIGGCCFMFDEM